MLCFSSEILTSHVPNLLLSDAAPVAPPPLPATPLWFQGNQELDLQIVDELSGGQGNFGFHMFQSNFG